jgi:hypothetical protein
MSKVTITIEDVAGGHQEVITEFGAGGFDNASVAHKLAAAMLGFVQQSHGGPEPAKFVQFPEAIVPAVTDQAAVVLQGSQSFEEGSK